MIIDNYDEGISRMRDIYRGQLKRLNAKGIPDSHPRIVFLNAKIKELNREVGIFKMRK